MIIDGLGDPNAWLNIYIGNRPDFPFLNQAQDISCLAQHEIYACGQACGNGWRKVFNVYAKLVYATGLSALMTPLHYKDKISQPASWQAYRDMLMLRKHSQTALLFSPVSINDLSESSDQRLHIVMGKAYANTLALPQDLIWINHEFALSKTHRLIVCPYFDYRQLSNVKIMFLVDLIKQLLAHKPLL